MPGDITQLISLTRSLEALGDSAVVQPQTTERGESFGHSVSADTSAVAKANEQVAQNVLSMIRESKLGDKYASLAERCFGDLASAGQPLTGREVAALLTAVIHSVECDLDFPAGEKTLEEFAAFLKSAPLDRLQEGGVPEDLGRVNPEQAVAFVERSTVVDTPPVTAPQISPATETAHQAIEDLQQFKDALGGSPHYPDRRPSYAPDTKTFFGIPRESCQEWFRNVPLEKGWVPQFFWKAVAGAFGVSKDTAPTRYESVSLYLESIRLLAENRDKIAANLRAGTESGGLMFSSLTRLACHIGENGGPEGMIRNMDAMLELFKSQYEHAKSSGTLQDFFDGALHGVCFENRFSNLQEYAVSHQPVAPGEEPGAALDLSRVADHKPDDDVVDACFNELTVSDIANKEYTWEDVKGVLMQTMLGKERFGINITGSAYEKTDARVTITEEMIDALRPVFNEALLFE